MWGGFPYILHHFHCFSIVPVVLIILWFQPCLRFPRHMITAHLGRKCRNSFRFWESVCEAEPLPHPPVSSLTIIKVPLSKALNPPLLCICSVVSRQDFGCSRQTPRWTCLCINDCNEQQDQRHRSQLQAGSDSCTNRKKALQKNFSLARALLMHQFIINICLFIWKNDALVQGVDAATFSCSCQDSNTSSQCPPFPLRCSSWHKPGEICAVGGD